jgi:beta-lactamase regulating signal transducer with metallopeptidase domain
MDALLVAGVWNAVGAALLAAIAALVGRFCRRPALVHALWLLVLLKMLTPPLWPVEVDWPSPESPSTTACANCMASLPDSFQLPRRPEGEALAANPLVPVNSAEPPGIPTSQFGFAVAAPNWQMPWLNAITVTWLAGAILYWSLTTLRAIRFCRILSRLPQAPEDLHIRCNLLANRLGLKRIPLVVLVPAPISPMVWALGAPARLLLPRAFWDELTSRQQDLILAHELAHLRRGDHRVRLLEIVAVGLYWWYPVAWWARRCLRETGELCCDACVVAAFPDAASDYAATLVESAAFLSRHAALVPAGASGLGPVPLLRRRVTMVLSAKTPSQLSRIGVASLLAAAAILLPLGPTRADPANAETPQAVESADAQKNLQTAVFWERTGHSGSAHFYYEVVMRRYPGTTAAAEAEKRLKELRKKEAAKSQPEGSPTSTDTANVQDGTLPPSELGVSLGQQASDQLAQVLQAEKNENQFVAAAVEAMFDRREHDFGIVKRGEAVAHSFKVTNHTKKPIDIDSLRSSAGWAKASCDTKSLKPGESANLKVEIDTMRFEGPRSIAVIVTIRGDKQAASARLTIKVNSRDDSTPPPVPQPNDARIKQLEQKIDTLLKELDELRREMKDGKAPGFSSGLTPAGTMTPDLGVPIAPDALKQLQRLDGFLISRTRQMKIPFDVDPLERDKISHLVLYVSRNEGKTWETADTKKIGESKAFSYTAPADGPYWFAVEQFDNAGKSTKDGRQGAVALKIRVMTDGK